MTPEEKARVWIDCWLEDAGWQVVNRDEYEANISAVAIREGLLEGNLEADYFLFINGKAIGVLEAKREEVDVSSHAVSEQVETYAKSVPSYYQAWMRPLPFLYKSNGKELLFKDLRNPDANWETLSKIHTPHELVKKFGIDDPFAGLPTLSKKGLRDCQYEAVTELEKSFKSGQNKALMVLATGAGKTYTACLTAYRMLSYTPMRRVLFLVDRNNLGKQAETEFGTFRLTETGDAFNTIFAVNRLRSSVVPSDSNVVISTIQRLFSLLKGETITDDDEDDDNQLDGEIVLPPNPNLPHDFFDLIIIDECHRSIYSNWCKVLEYFDTARLIGLTATPIPKTMSFFNNNRVVNYTLEQSIVDGVNVDGRVYRIRTQATTNGGAIMEGEKVQVETRYTGEVKTISNKETKTYTKEELNRSIINPSQIKLILQTYRDRVYSELYPDREADMDYLPKTLIFALNDAHADNIVKIAKEVFERSDDRFVQKITYSAGDSNELIRQFRNDKDFRIAVTCTLVATGTDVKPLEVLIFMRDVASLPLYTQMKGRGVRTIGDEHLRNVTPNAISKDCYFLVDAVGVTEHGHDLPGTGGGGEPPIPLKILLERIAHGYLPDKFLRRLAATLAKLHHKANDEQRQHYAELAEMNMIDMAARIFAALEAENLPPFSDVNEPNTERKALVAPLPNNAELRKYILELAAGFVTTLMPGEDELLFTGFTKEDAQNDTEAFEQYCNEHRDEIEALRIIYNNQGDPITYAMLRDLKNKLAWANHRLDPQRIWNAYATLKPDNVRRNKTGNERDAITNIIQLVRYAYRQIERLESFCYSAENDLERWCGQIQGGITPQQREIMKQIVDYIAANGACSVRDINAYNPKQATRLRNAFGGMDNANAALLSLYNFVVRKQTA